MAATGHLLEDVKALEVLFNVRMMSANNFFRGHGDEACKYDPRFTLSGDYFLGIFGHFCGNCQTDHDHVDHDSVMLLLRWGCREHFVSGCWHSSGRDRGHYPRECWLSTLGVLHPGVPVMWYGHIRDLSPTADGCMGGRMPNVTLVTLGTTKVCSGGL